MAYGITRYNKQPVASVVDGTVDNTLDITLIGKNYAGYGRAFNDDLVWLLENFSNTTPPPKPISGQLWFDATTTNLKINLYEEVNNQWKTLAVNNISTSQPAFATTGDMWYDETNNQLNIFNGATYDLVGPQNVTGKGITQMQSVSLTDTLLGTHAVQLAYANGTILFIVSKEEFTPNPSIAGFPTIYQGITINDQAKFNGTATNSDNLGNNPPSFYAPLRNTVFPTLTTFNAGLTTGSLTVNNAKIQAVGNTITLSTSGVDVVSVNGLDLLPSVTAASNIGSDTLRFKNIYAGYMYGTSQNADYLKVGGNYRSANTTSVNNTIVARDGSGGIASTSLLTGNITSASITSSGTIFANTSVTSPNFYGNATTADQAIHADQADQANLASVALAVEWAGVLNRPQNFVYDDQNAKFYRINITGTSNGTHNGPVFGPMTGNLYSTDSTLFFDATAKQVGFFGANLVGNLTGNSAGTHTGPVVGNVTGNVIGNLTGNTAGTHTGPVVGNVTGNLTGNTAGTHTGPVVGNVTGNSAGIHTGPVVGNVTGNLTGNTVGFHTGNLYSTDSTLFFNASTKQLGFAGANIVGSFTGPLLGNVTGNLIGNTAGTHTGPVAGNVTGNVTGDLTGTVYAQNGRVLLSNGNSANPSIAFYNDGAQDTGFYWGGDGFINIANNGGYSGQFQPNGNLSMQGQIFASSGFSGNLTGNVIGNLTGNVTGNLIGNTSGTHTGPVVGNITGNSTGTHTGPVVGNVTGNVTGNITGTAFSVRNQGATSPAEDNYFAEQSGLTLRSVYNNGFPTQYGNLLSLGGSGGGQVVVGWSDTSGAHADNYVRSRRDTGTTWSPWAKILTDVNFGNTLARVAATGSYNDLGDKPAIPQQIASPQAQLQNIVQTIVGSIDLHTNGYYNSGGSTYGGFLGGGWSTSITSNTVNTYGSTDSVNLVIDLASYFGLSSDPANLRWKGNYDLNIAPSLKSIFDGRINYYGLDPSTWAVSVFPYTFDKTSSDYGKFSIGVTIRGDHWYHGTTITAGWIGIGSRTNNVYNP